MKRILSLVIILFVCCGCTKHFTPIAKAYSVSCDKNVSYTYEDLDILTELITEHSSMMDAAHKMAESARHLGYQDDHAVIALAKEEYYKAEEEMLSYKSVYDNLENHWARKKAEYPTATKIWEYLKDLGYNNEVCAGILGNIMTEVGGNSLIIDETLETETYYGMCQWNKKAYSDVYGASLSQQCNYLRDTIQYEINTFGSKYKKDFNYEKFILMDDITECALAFAKTYERCSSGSFYTRQENAIVAYNYFVGG